MVAEAQSESPVPESAYADYEQDLLDDGVPPAQARATRRALERVVDRMVLALASKSDLRELRTEMHDEFSRVWEQIVRLREDVAALKAEMRLFRWMFALSTSAIIGLISAVLVVLLTRL